MTTEKRIVNWNVERNITSVPDDKLVLMCKIEEMFEFLGVNKAMPKPQFKALVNSYVGHFMNEAKAYDATATIEEKIDALCDDNVFNDGFIYRFGYDPELAMNQCLLHIESRKGTMGEDGKWHKSEDDLVYEPRYNEAVL